MTISYYWTLFIFSVKSPCINFTYGNLTEKYEACQIKVPIRPSTNHLRSLETGDQFPPILSNYKNKVFLNFSGYQSCQNTLKQWNAVDGLESTVSLDQSISQWESE